MSDQSRKYYGLEELDRKLERYLDYDSGYFVELGANDGVSQSNTCYFERSRGWRGVLIEPVVHNYFQCKRVRSRENHFFCNACVSFEYSDAFVPVLYCNLMTTPLHVGTDISNPVGHVASGQRHLPAGEEIVLFGASARTLHDILQEAKSPQVIDLLSLDVEGAEIEVLKGVDFSVFRFRYICVECRSIKVMVPFLDKHGYELVEHLQRNDYLFRYVER